MMIGGQTISGYITQLIVLGQPFLWMSLYDSDFKIPNISKHVFYFTGFVFLSVIAITQFSIGFYTSQLFIQYTAMTMVATAVFNIKYRFKEAVSLGFLTVFLNSFYWELPLHLAELLSGPPHVGMLVQACRLIPLPWLLNHYEFDKKRSKVLITVGLFISYLLHIIAYMNLFAPRTSIHVLNRVFSLGFLVTTVYLAKPKKYMSIKEGVY